MPREGAFPEVHRKVIIRKPNSPYLEVRGFPWQGYNVIGCASAALCGCQALLAASDEEGLFGRVLEHLEECHPW